MKPTEDLDYDKFMENATTEAWYPLDAKRNELNRQYREMESADERRAREERMERRAEIMKVAREDEREKMERIARAERLKRVREEIMRKYEHSSDASVVTENHMKQGNKKPIKKYSKNPKKRSNKKRSNKKRSNK
jgi:hypothetical protein